MNTAENTYSPPSTPEPKPSDSRATPRTVDWSNPRVSAILEAAAKCFARKGFSATTLAEIGKELGLRKSIVHYYFASKAALIHEVQSYTNHKYLERVRESLKNGDSNTAAMRSLWSATEESNVGLNIEVWSTSRNDEELKRRASALQQEKRKLVADGLTELLGADVAARAPMQSLCTLILGVLNGLSVSEYVEGEGAQAQEAYGIFLSLLKLAAEHPQALSVK
ncbi:MAG TPA: TetR/AcrR family transcriptional regulator [Polyangiaceae bacterium]|nr:TetR/AcrR family transcriptional regulator [Polyangiaceae bacterium]